MRRARVENKLLNTLFIKMSKQKLPPAELPLNCGTFSTKDETKDKKVGGFSAGIALCIVGLVVALLVYKSSKDVTDHMSIKQTKLFWYIFATLLLLVGIGGFSYGIFYTIKSTHEQRAGEWPTIKDEQLLCKNFINLKHNAGGESVSISNVTTFTIPKNKVINRLKFSNLANLKFTLSVRNTLGREISTVIPTQQLLDSTLSQSPYDAFYSSDNHDMIISSEGAFSVNFYSYDIPAEYKTYITTRGIIGKTCTQNLLFVDSNYTDIKEVKVYCEVL